MNPQETDKGKPCRLCVKYGHLCGTHNGKVDLSARNKKVAEAARRNDPKAYIEQKRTAGKKGFAVTSARHGLHRALEAARQHRLRFPSGPEIEAMAVLDCLNLDYDRERVLDGTWFTIDLVIKKGHRELPVEVAGHQHKASFGESEPRWGKLMQKVKTIEKIYGQCLILDWRHRDMWSDMIQGAI